MVSGDTPGGEARGGARSSPPGPNERTGPGARRFVAVASVAVLGLAAAIASLIRFGEPRALAVLEVSPADGARDVARQTQITATFSRPLDEGSVQAGLALDPATPGFVSAAGRRAAFTPRFGLRGDTTYTVTLGPGLRDRGGRGLADPVVSRFRTRALGLVLRTSDGRLFRARLGVPAEASAGSGVGAVAVSEVGTLAYATRDGLVVDAADGGPARRVALPAGLAVRELEWVPGGRALVFLGAVGEGLERAYLVRLERPTPAVEPLGPGPGALDPTSALVTEVLKKSLVEIVYRHDSFALTPDGRAGIVRDQTWDFALVGLDGARRASLGPYLAVGNMSPRGDALAVVDVNPADPALRRQVLVHGAAGTAARVSSPERDSHSPRFAHQGDRLVFASGEATGLPGTRRFALEVVDRAGSAPRRLTEPPPGESDESPRWSPDDVWILFRRGPAGAPERSRVWIVAAERGPARPVEPPAVDARWVP